MNPNFIKTFLIRIRQNNWNEFVDFSDRHCKRRLLHVVLGDDGLKARGGQLEERKTKQRRWRLRFPAVLQLKRKRVGVCAGEM